MAEEEALATGQSLCERGGDAVDGTMPLSKKAMKRALAQKKFEANKMAKRQYERQKRKDKAKQRRELVAQGMETELPSRSRVNLNQQSSGVRVVIDLDFEGKMMEKEARSLCDQLRYCYGANRRCGRSVDMIMTGYTATIKRLLDTKQTDHKNWKTIRFIESSYIDHLDASSLVYLTADSPNVLTELEIGKAYIVGGLVDHNRHRSLCLNRAIEQGIAHAQLPIGDYIKLNSRRVLTVNQCVEIMLKVLENGNDWRQAFTDVIPQRKVCEETNSISMDLNSKPDESIKESTDTLLTSVEVPLIKA